MLKFRLYGLFWFINRHNKQGISLKVLVKGLCKVEWKWKWKQKFLLSNLNKSLSKYKVAKS